jgi:hypothetical protein
VVALLPQRLWLPLLMTLPIHRQAGVKADEGTLLVVGDLNFRCELLSDPVSKAKGGKDWEAVRCQALPLIRVLRCSGGSCVHRSGI